jgi:fructose-bisphosphate aldolase, class II
MPASKSRIPNGFKKALAVGRPPNVVKLFPNSNALLVSGKYIDRAMLARGQAIAIAANGRNAFVIRGVLKAAQRANAAIIIEIAKSEGGAEAYCAVNFWNLARIVDACCNEMGITVPVAIHADHFGIKGAKDIEAARTEIPSMFDAGITSIAIDASHLLDDQNLLASIELSPCILKWTGLEAEGGEIKGKERFSAPGEALFLIQGLNAYGIFPDWIALNNGTTHGIEASDSGIQVDLIFRIHEAIAPYKVSGAQHGTSGNSSERLLEIAERTRTTKANVATALQMISWGLEVKDYGDAFLDANGNFIKLPERGLTETLCAEMVTYAQSRSLKAGDYKKLNLPFENKLLGLPRPVRARMVRRVEDFSFQVGDEAAPMPTDIIDSAMGVNGKDYDPQRHWIVSYASFATTCRAHNMRLLLDAFGTKRILSASMAIVHAATRSRRALDRLPEAGKTDVRKSCSIMNNIILTSTGADNALRLVIPEMHDISFISELAFVAATICSVIMLNLEEKPAAVAIDQSLVNPTYRQTAAEREKNNLINVEKQNASANIIPICPQKDDLKRCHFREFKRDHNQLYREKRWLDTMWAFLGFTLLVFRSLGIIDCDWSAIRVALDVVSAFMKLLLEWLAPRGKKHQ